jgi:serine/threonine protein phosphatase PrpC
MGRWRDDNRGVRLSAGGATDRGPRPANQDSYLVDLELGLLVVADGMGGHNAGEVASRMAVDAVADFIRATHQGGEITWPFPLNPTQSVAVNRVEVALRIANQRVHDAGERDPDCSGMGTTIVTALIDGDQIVVGHVGDSRAYIWRNGSLRQVTQDHTWLNAIDDGQEDLRNHPLRHVLTNGIGMGADLTPDEAESTLVAGDRWLICTDGVHGSLDRATLEVIMNGRSAQTVAQEAVQRALSAGTTDNATAVVLNAE